MEVWTVRFIKGSSTFSPSTYTLPSAEAVEFIMDDIIQRIDEIEHRIEIEGPDGRVTVHEAGMDD
jgi:hypothetical protein